MATKEPSWILHPKSGDLEGINNHMLNFISQSFYIMHCICIQYFAWVILVNLYKHLHIGLTSVLFNST